MELQDRIEGYNGRTSRGPPDVDDDRNILDKLGSVAGGIVSKVESTVKNFAESKPTEENPISYKVIHKGGALVRSGYETTSSQVHQLSAGEVVNIVEISGRRARIITPIDGWISLETKDGVQIMRQCHLQRKGQKAEAFETAFEKKFQKIKADKTREIDPRAETSDQSRSPSPRYRDDNRSSKYDAHPEDRRWKDDRDRRDYDRDRRDDRDRRGDRDRRDRSDSRDRRDDRDRRDRDRRDRDRSDSPPPRKKEDKFVPKLSQPGKSGNAAVPALAGPGSKPAAGGGISAGASNDAFNFIPGASAPAPAAGGGALDLLDMSAPAAAPAQPLDLFSAEIAPAATTPVLPVTPSQGAGSAGDWNAFQSTAPQAPQGQMPNAPNNFAAFGGAPGAQAQPQGFQQQQMGGQMGGFMGAQQPQPGWGGMGQPNMGQAPMGMGAVAPGMGMGMGQNPMMGAQQTGYGSAFGPQAGMGGMAPNMGGMAPGMNPGMGGMMGQGGMAQGGMAPGMGGFQNVAAGRGGGAMPGGGATGPASSGTAPAAGAVDDLLSKAMDGVANMSFEQRNTGASRPIQPQVPMNMMQQPRGW